MIDNRVTDLLERTADQIPVGAPPLDAIRVAASRRRRRRTVLVLAASAVTVATVIGATTLVTSRAPVVSNPPAPATTRLVGFGHALVAVPKDWPTNQSTCGTAQRDTVLVDDPSAAHLCLASRPTGVESVEVHHGNPSRDFHSDQTYEIDGVRAERQRTTCSESRRATATVTTCAGTVVIPSLQVWFRAESSTDASEVDRILERIQIVPGQSGVPSYSAISPQSLWPRVGNYAPLLTEAGLKAQYKRVKSPSYPRGTVLGVAPAPGTVLPSGSTVAVTVSD